MEIVFENFQTFQAKENLFIFKFFKKLFFGNSLRIENFENTFSLSYHTGPG